MSNPAPRQLLDQPIIWLLAGLLTLVIIFSLHKSTQSASMSADSLERFEDSLEQVDVNITQLEEQLTASQSPLYLEKIWRNELLLGGEQELVLQVSEDFYRTSLESGQVETVQEKTNWEEWMEVIIAQ